MSEVVVEEIWVADDNDDGSKVRGEVFADTSFSKTGIAAGVTATAMKVRMVDSMSARESAQTYIFDQHKACPSCLPMERRNIPSLSSNPSLAQILGILRAYIFSVYL